MTANHILIVILGIVWLIASFKTISRIKRILRGEIKLVRWEMIYWSFTLVAIAMGVGSLIGYLLSKYGNTIIF